MAEFRIMIVDDEAFVVEELAEALSEEGCYAVVTAGSGTAALDLPDLAGIDVVVTDLKMPGMTGIDLLTALRGRGVGAAAILLSGHGAQAERDEAFAAGFFACLSKPVDIDDLLEAVAAARDSNKESTP